MCGLLMHDCRRPDAPPPRVGIQLQYGIMERVWGSGWTDFVTSAPSDWRFAFINDLTI